MGDGLKGKFKGVKIYSFEDKNQFNSWQVDNIVEDGSMVLIGEEAIRIFENVCGHTIRG